MLENKNIKLYDLEERTLSFARRVNKFVNFLPKTLSNLENGKQLVRSAGSVGANYIEANEALGRKDFFMRVKISRKESKESRFWLLLIEPVGDASIERDLLVNEATEFIKIFSTMLKKSD